MSPLTARAVSMAVVGGVSAAILSRIGLQDWSAFLAWGAFLAAGADDSAVKKTLVGCLFGAFIGWVALFLRHQVDTPAGSMLWMPRMGIAAAAALFVLVMASRSAMLSHFPATLAGYAAVLGTLTVPMMELRGLERLSGAHLYNPFIQVSLSMIAGVGMAIVAGKLTASLSKS